MRDDGGVRLLLPATLITVLAPLLTAGCSTGSDPSPSTGIDELVIPTPSPDPTDFVATIDNPWFVLDEASYVDDDGATLQQVVAPGPVVGGVATTAVTLADVTDLYAQDDRGNVWWWGREGEWTAGTGGAEAGLAMPAAPRVGDGWRRAEVVGEDLRAEVLEVDADAVVLEMTTDGQQTRTTYTRDEGLDLVETLAGDVVLVRV